MENSASASQNPYASPAVPTNTESISSSPNKPNEPLIQPIHISGDLSLEDFVFAARFIRRIGPVKYGLIFTGILNVFLCIILCPILYQTAKDLQLGYQIVEFSLPLIPVVIFVGLMFFLPKFAYKKAWEYGKYTYSNINQLLSEDYFDSMSEKENTRIKWSAFGTCHVTDRLVIALFQGQKFRYQIFPRNCFQTQHDWECFLGLLDRKLPRC